MKGFIRVPVSTIQHALMFSSKYYPLYIEKNKLICQQAKNKLIERIVGTRSFSNGLYMIPMSKHDAADIADSKLKPYTFYDWKLVCEITETNYDDAMDRLDFIRLTQYHIKELQTIADLGKQLDYILLDIDSCRIVNNFIKYTEREDF